MDAVTLQLFSGGQEACLASTGLLLRSLSVPTLVFTNRAAVHDCARPQDCVRLQELLFLGSILDHWGFFSSECMSLVFSCKVGLQRKVQSFKPNMQSRTFSQRHLTGCWG